MTLLLLYLLGERLFAQFDKKKKVEQKDDDHLIDFDEFITGLAIVCRGTVDEKIHFLFNMYDPSFPPSFTINILTHL